MLAGCGKSFLGRQHDSLLDNKKVQSSNRKTLYFKELQVKNSHKIVYANSALYRVFVNSVLLQELTRRV